jgi:NTE family protein
LATDLLHQKAIVFNKGSFYKAARASVAIPGVVTPLEYKDTILVDGGVLNPVPIEQIPRQKNDLLVVVNLYGKKTGKQFNPITSEKENLSYLESLRLRLLNLSLSGHKKNKNFFSLMSCTSSVMLSRIAQLSIEKHQPDITINIPQDYVNTFEFYKAKDIIQYGETVAEKAIEQYLKSEELQSL